MTAGLFGTILVATDGSEKNRAAVEEAVRIGRTGGSVVHAVYVADTASLDSASADIVISDTWELLQREGEQALNRVRGMAGGVHLETVILEGKPAAEIVKYAGEKGDRSHRDRHAGKAGDRAYSPRECCGEHHPGRTLQDPRSKISG